MNLTIDEAIMNIDEEMERLRDDIENAEITGITVNYTGFNNHIDSKRQLVDWLKELKELREQIPCEDAVSRKWLLECVNERWIKFDTEKDENRFIHLVRDIAPSVQPEKR